MADQNYFLPGEYIGDMHNGVAHIVNRIEDRLGEPVEVDLAQFEIQSEAQREALEKFLDATRALIWEGHIGYLNKMLIAVDDGLGAYMYDGRYFGFVKF